MIEAVPTPVVATTEPPSAQFELQGTGLGDLRLPASLGSGGPEAVRLLHALAEFYDDDTPAHSARVGRCAGLIAQALESDEEFVAQLTLVAPLHDVGKIGISRRVLLKASALTPFERENMMRHVEIGARILSVGDSPYLRLAARVAQTHHERWDGGGYMLGLIGEEIPLAGRITAVADVFDALTHVRPYRAAWDVDQALAELKAKAGSQFDPRVVAAFCSLEVGDLVELPEPESAGRPLLGAVRSLEGSRLGGRSER